MVASSNADVNSAVDLRQSPRRVCCWPVRVRAPDGSILVQKALNASSDGVMLELDFSPLPNSILLMKFAGMHRGRLLDFVAKGRVCYTVMTKNRYHAGIQFTQIPPQFSEFLRAFVYGEV